MGLDRVPETNSAMALEGHVACGYRLDKVEERRACLDVLGNPLRQVRHDGLRRPRHKQPMDLDTTAVCCRGFVNPNINGLGIWD